MKLNCKIGDIIHSVDVRNANLQCDNLLGLSMTKEFRPSTSNIVGTDLSKYKIVGFNHFAVDFMSAIRVHKMPIALNQTGKDIIVSPAYGVFAVNDENVVLPEFLMLWFRRPDFDRYADFKSDSAIRGGYDWNELCETEIDLPPISEQRKIVHDYQVVTDRIELLRSINNELHALMETVYKNMFPFDVDAMYSGAPLASLCTDIQRGFTPVYAEKSTIFDLNQKVNKGTFLDKQFFAYIDEGASISKDKFARKHDILLNYLGDGTLGRVHYYNEDTDNVVVNQFIIIIRTNTELLLPEYLYSLLASKEYQQIILGSVSGSTGMLVLNISTIREFKIFVPPLAIQKEYSTKVDKIWSQLTNNYLEISKLEVFANILINSMNKGA